MLWRASSTISTAAAQSDQAVATSGGSLADKAPTGNGLERSRQGAVAYYADSVEGPGRWMGRGLYGFAPAGQVRREELELMLLGCHPATGHRLLHASGSAERARQHHEAEGAATLCPRRRRDGLGRRRLPAIGAAVGGTATEVLRDATGMECSTVASLLARLDNGGALDHRNVVIVDECSTLANRDLAALMHYAERDGAALRLVGDPAQHSAVAAGGAWRALLERYPDDRAELTERRRQGAPEMAEVRCTGRCRRRAGDRLRRRGSADPLRVCPRCPETLRSGPLDRRRGRPGASDQHLRASTAPSMPEFTPENPLFARFWPYVFRLLPVSVDP
ncbi:MAG TPA: AAA family ATPase [Acidimicrobiales bacterium]|nr:AAA family ATPase [Acidimicrobiales bacterium]